MLPEDSDNVKLEVVDSELLFPCPYQLSNHSIYIYIYIYIYKYIYLNLPRNVIVRLALPRSGDSQGQEKFLAPSSDKQQKA